MIYLYPVGGLGNMLFQIAATYAIAKDNNDELCLLNIEKRINEVKNDKRWSVPHANEYLQFFSKFNIQNKNINKSVSCVFHYETPQYVNEAQYIGYFQSEKYFKKYRQEILELFKPNQETIDYIDSKYKHLYNQTALHVRRGDYVNNSEKHPVQTLEYFQKALQFLKNQIIVDKIVVFSDDQKWCKENFIGDEYIFISEKDYQEIYLMSRMNNFIISNSTFSWWGVWLAEINNITIAPNKWFGPKLNNISDKDICPDSWIKM